jgi:hypothetical protein
MKSLLAVLKDLRQSLTWDEKLDRFHSPSDQATSALRVQRRYQF